MQNRSPNTQNPSPHTKAPSTQGESPGAKNASADMINVPKRLDQEAQEALLKQIKSLLKRHSILEEELEERENDEAQAEVLLNAMRARNAEDLAAEVAHLHPADIAFILGSLPPESRLKVWQVTHPEHDGDVLLEVDDWVREELIADLEAPELIAATEGLDADELADLVPDLPPEVVAEVQKSLSEEEREQLLHALGHPEGTVGAIMDFEMVRVREDVSLEVVLRYLRMLGELPEHTDQLFVVDRHNHLCGVLSLTDLLVNEPEKSVTDVMNKDMLSLSASDKDTNAASVFERYDLVSAPVVDDDKRLIGRVTVTDIVDVIREDITEHHLSQAGMQEEDIFVPLRRVIPNRAPWLLVNLVTASIASIIASRFENTVEQVVILAFLMSIVAGIGGNSGNQTMTMVIRSIAMGRVNKNNARLLLRREILVTTCVGLIGSSIAGLFAWFFSGSVKIALVMAAAIQLNMLVGAVLGVLIPTIRSRLNKDPALGSSVLLTFATDSLGFFIFLGLATLFLL